MTGPTKTVKPKAAPKPKAEPLKVASNDDLLSMLASINQLLKLQLKLSGFNLTVNEALVI